MAGRQPGFWDVEERLRELSAQGDPLEKLAATVDFEMFRPDLDAALGRGDPGKDGRPPFDAVLKFRMLVLQALHGLSLQQAEFLVSDRLSWMRFCGLGPGDPVPDANTLWDFREALIGAGALDVLFARLDQAITQAGYLPMSGQIVDATLVAAPRQRNTEAEKAAIKEGKTADEIWPEKPGHLRKLRWRPTSSPPSSSPQSSGYGERQDGGHPARDGALRKRPKRSRRATGPHHPARSRPLQPRGCPSRRPIRQRIRYSRPRFVLLA